MAEIVNLRTVRRQKARSDKAAAADANRIKHGTSTKLRKQNAAQKDLENRQLDGKKRED